MRNNSYAPHYAISRYSIREFKTGAEPFMVAMIIIYYYIVSMDLQPISAITHIGKCFLLDHSSGSLFFMIIAMIGLCIDKFDRIIFILYVAKTLRILHLLGLFPFRSQVFLRPFKQLADRFGNHGLSALYMICFHTKIEYHSKFGSIIKDPWQFLTQVYHNIFHTKTSDSCI